MPRRLDHHQWTDEELATLIELREDEGMEWQAVANRMGVDKNAASSRYHALFGNEGRLSTRKRATESTKCPNIVLIEREKRYAAIIARNDFLALHGDVSFLIGDMPPPGHSALDRKRGRLA